jgi:pyruvate dehydrogenase E2 component (dihydrolipoamide acetyltransferase)
VTRVALEIPKVGLVMESARLIRWLKNVGDAVAQGEPLLELETEKSVVEIESTESGRLAEILLRADQEVRVGDRIAWIETDTLATADAAVTQASAAPPVGGPDTPKAPTPVAAVGRLDTHAAPTSPAAALNPPPATLANNTGRIVSSPAARRLAATHSVDLRLIEGTGPRGRVQLKDVHRAVDSRTAPGASADAASVGAASVGAASVGPASAGIGSAGIASAGTASAGAASAAAPAAPLLSGMRRALARSMTLSNATVPQFTVERAVDWTSVYRLRAATPGPSINDFILQAMGAALLAFPALNAIFSGDANSTDASIVPSSGAHIGLVVAVEDGLLVPVLHGIEQLGLAELTSQRRALVERALKRTLKREELEGATISLSNLGARGPDRFNALINPPQSAILAVGRRGDRVVALNGGVHVRPMSQLTLTVDHRVADGRLASDFLAFVVDTLEGNVRR